MTAGSLRGERRTNTRRPDDRQSGRGSHGLLGSFRHGLMLILLVTVTCALPIRSEEAEGWTRIAVIAASQRGMSGDRPLRYAYQDGERLAKMLSTVGQVDPANLFFLKVEGKATFQDSLAAIAKRIAALKAENHKVFLQFYYTGHGGAKHFHFVDGQMSFDELKEALGSEKADARVYVLDVCFGASFFNAKGFKTAPPVQLQMEMDRAARGEVTISSSSVNEQAYEVRTLGGSIFTSHWIMALRGAGDRNRDGQVTLFEAYNYAYDRTAGYSAETLDRPQHPSYQIDLTGARDVMLARLLHSSTGILFKQCPSGLYNLVDLQKGIQIGELRIPEGEEFTLALDPGRYRVQYLPRKGPSLGADLELTASAMTALPFSAFQVQAAGEGVPKGSAEALDEDGQSADAEDMTHPAHSPDASTTDPKSGSDGNGVTGKLPTSSMSANGIRRDRRTEGFWESLGYAAWGGQAAFLDQDLENSLNQPPPVDQYFGFPENFTAPRLRSVWGVSLEEPIGGAWSYGARLGYSSASYSEKTSGRENLQSIPDGLRDRYPVNLDWNFDFNDVEFAGFLGRNMWVTEADLFEMDAGAAVVLRSGESQRTLERPLYDSKTSTRQSFDGTGYRFDLGFTYRRALPFGIGRRRWELGLRAAPYLSQAMRYRNADGETRTLESREFGLTAALYLFLPAFHGGIEP